jgi:hypothetical protein
VPDLTKKLGPFPLWIWGIGGAGLVYWYHKNHPTASALPAQPMTSQNAAERRYRRRGGKGGGKGNRSAM